MGKKGAGRRREPNRIYGENPIWLSYSLRGLLRSKDKPPQYRRQRRHMKAR
ncbi:hypothetical protein ES705_28818 [subsurface metagenome]